MLHPKETMRKLFVLFYLITATTQAQKMTRQNIDDVDPVDTEAPIGLDLMGGNKQGVTVYPNADNDHILISVAGSRAQHKTITISDLNGNVVFHTPKSVENTYMVDVSGLRKELYIVEVYSGSKVYRKKWMNN